MMRSLVLCSCLVATASAQTIVDVPNLLSFVNVDLPFPAGLGRYQEWYRASAFGGAITEPMRIEQLQFLAGTQPTSQAAMINCEILMGHGKASGVNGTFDNNWDSPPITVKPPGLVMLNPAPPGGVCMTIPLATRFTWDATRPVLIEIRVSGNSLGNQPFLYNFRGTTQSIGSISRVFAGGSPGATSGTVAQGYGMITRFQARPGAVLEFGSGCPGEGGFVPQNTVLQVPSPGITWDHRISNAPSQRLAFWIIGDTNAAPFPIDLTALLGLPASGCLLLTNPANAIAVQTVGGGAGGGLATLPVSLPGTTGYVGLSIYTQWVVFDPLAPNGILAVTPGAWSIVAPVGG